jgi:hypothetical protein
MIAAGMSVAPSLLRGGNVGTAGERQSLSPALTSISLKEYAMATEKHHPGEHHENAATHHEHAAAHHRQAARHHEAGETEKANHHAHVAHGHSTSATEHAGRAATHQATEHGHGKGTEKGK